MSLSLDSEATMVLNTVCGILHNHMEMGVTQHRRVVLGILGDTGKDRGVSREILSVPFLRR